MSTTGQQILLYDSLALFVMYVALDECGTAKDRRDLLTADLATCHPALKYW
jgi:hypothetical protein